MPDPTPRRIAVFRAIFLGDLLLAVPAWRALRAAFPAAEITLIGLPWAESFVRRFGHYVDRFLEFPGFPGIDEVPLDPGRIAAFLAEQHAYGYDLAIQMHGSGLTSNAFVLALGARRSAGYAPGRPPPGLRFSAPYPDNLPEIERNLRLVELLGCRRPADPDEAVALEFPLGPEDRAEAAALLADLPPGGPLVALHPGAKAPARRWPPEYFAAVGDALATRHGARILLTGGPAERPITAAVRASMWSPALDLAGRTSLGGLAALIDRLALFISNDTGPAHLADALDTPSITVFGAADLVRWAPLDCRRHVAIPRAAECSPACGVECALDQRCLRGVPPEAVLAEAARLLAETPALAAPGRRR